jgi:CRISPR-associated protein Csd1
MILQSLYDYYQKKLTLGEIAPLGYAKKEIDFIIVIDKNGNYVNVERVQHYEGKRLRGTEYLVPRIGKQVEKHDNSGNDANLLWDKAEFAIGIGKKGSLKNTSFVNTINTYYPHPPDNVAAILRYLKKENKRSKPFAQIVENNEFGEIVKTGSPIITFKIIGDVEPITSQPHITKAIDEKKDGNSVFGTCLITGFQNVPIEETHTVTKGIMGSQTSGANLVSFNKSAFVSFKKDQSLNAPISKKAAESYTKALQHLVDSTTNKVRIADSTIVFWSESAPKVINLEEIVSWVVAMRTTNEENPDKGVQAVKALYDSVFTGNISQEKDNRFYALALAPNAARISVRFWRTGTVEIFGKRIYQHFEDFEIVKADYESQNCTLNEILASVAVETKDRLKPNAVYFRGKLYDVPSNLASAVIESILDGTPYPATLMQQCIRRIRAEVAHKEKNGKLLPNVNRTRAAILKAYLNRINKFKNNNKEVCMSLDKENKDAGYVLGRLFALLEKIQEESAKPTKLNSTIRERYYGSFSSSPITVMPLLMKLKNHHLAKLSGNNKQWIKNWLEGELAEVVDLLKPINIPAHLVLEQQAFFAVGYYHQKSGMKKSKSIK